MTDGNKKETKKSSDDFLANIDKTLDKNMLLSLLDSLIKEQDLVAELNLNGDGQK